MDRTPSIIAADAAGRLADAAVARAPAMTMMMIITRHAGRRRTS
jgi:hypothetical protein